jgi:proline dehydrogenase
VGGDDVGETVGSCRITVVRTASLRRRVAYALATSDELEAAVRRVPPLADAAFRSARRYVAGERLDDALAVARRLVEDGFAVSLDFFGESVADEGSARAATGAYVELARALDELPGDASVALDPSHLGLDVSPALFRELLEQVASALPPGRRIDVGAEDGSRTEAALGVAAEAALAGIPLQMTLQANLRRSGDDARALADAGIAVRLVKGAYVEPSARALRYGDETDLAYLRLARDLHGAGARLALATHDRVLREALLAMLGPVPVEMLLGVRERDARELVARGIPVRLYVPYGRNWFRYWGRRVAEAQGA